MILTTVGTEPYPFNRLMTWLDVLLKRGCIQEEAVVQYGYCTVWPNRGQCFSELPEDTLNQFGVDARLTIADCNLRALQWCDRTTRPYILVPRAECYNEHIDNRQIELGSSLALAGVPIAWSPGDLVRFIESPRRIARSTVKAVANQPLKRSL